MVKTTMTCPSPKPNSGSSLSRTLARKSSWCAIPTRDTAFASPFTRSTTWSALSTGTRSTLPLRGSNLPRSSLKQLATVPGDLDILFARHHAHLDSSQTFQPLTDTGAHAFAVFANPTREHEHINPTQHGREPRNELRDLPTEDLERKLRTRLALRRRCF